jgi:hypothetical protein
MNLCSLGRLLLLNNVSEIFNEVVLYFEKKSLDLGKPR